MAGHRSGIQLTPEEQVEIFGSTAFSEACAAKAEERWGDTDVWKQSQQRAGALTKQDWQQLKAEGDTLLVDLADAKRDGVEPGSDGANALASRHRDSIERFYDCTPQMHGALAEMYLADQRFMRYYADVEPGLARFVHDIIVASYPT